MSENDTPPSRTIGIATALGEHEHLERISAGQGRFYPQPDGEQKFACDMGESLWGCGWCDTFAWPDGNPLDLDDDTEAESA